MLRKIAPLALVIALGAFTYSAVTPTPAAVGAQEFSASSASVASGFLCGVLVDLTTQSHATLSSSGNETLICSSDSPFAPPPKTLVIKGLGCGLFFSGFTTNSKITINKKEANLWCKT